MKRIAYTITLYTTVIRLLGVVQNPANGFPARPLGATKAAEALARRMRKQDFELGQKRGREEGRAEGQAEGRAGERKELRKRLEAIAENNPDVKQLIDELEGNE